MWKHRIVSITQKIFLFQNTFFDDSDDSSDGSDYMKTARGKKRTKKSSFSCFFASLSIFLIPGGLNFRLIARFGF